MREPSVDQQDATGPEVCYLAHGRVYQSDGIGPVVGLDRHASQL